MTPVPAIAVPSAEPDGPIKPWTAAAAAAPPETDRASRRSATATPPAPSPAWSLTGDGCNVLPVPNGCVAVCRVANDVDCRGWQQYTGNTQKLIPGLGVAVTGRPGLPQYRQASQAHRGSGAPAQCGG
ncbi:hypothetical protein VaNZ11_011340 [Volvox africanus]|uniref:Uncharacterized protein n=1 Tax=Volvox africanus TaxID=51714 RepID=A0ABQ5SC53_9CHLO|nr:hypothetical protein VaNZ11_011340 [Volvox africanus]